MAQTKRKRRNKHRGNAAGAVEARGRTSKPRADAKPVKGGRGVRAQAAARAAKPPSWKSAAMKAAFGGVTLFLFARFGLLGDEAKTSSALLLAVMAVAFYTPIMFLTDRWIYQRKQRQTAGGTAKR